MTPERLARGHELVARYPRPQSALVPFLQYCQEQDGYVTLQAMRDAAELVGITPGEVESIASFYTLLFKAPAGKHIVQVCRTLSCMLRGAEDLQAYIKRRLGIGHLETSADGQYYYEEVECLAACDRAPCLQHNLEYHYDVTPASFDKLLDSWQASAPAPAMPAE
ncbi:MAG: NAD(P)H-dependent oxidoreductase subunit E [Candidatus Eremiobacteraeota bacterium]|nr:NAD(P)H-dependent oxidoreductase subunit E [Candidatus Eremiobacteraeota bacterium]MBV8365093.1 NAD(P)H-dependent oxidoreductase subunit E [Candidatus Eremiobacteraeota bacterium]